MEKKSICTQCGSNIAPDSLFCPHCGNGKFQIEESIDYVKHMLDEQSDIPSLLKKMKLSIESEVPDYIGLMGKIVGFIESSSPNRIAIVESLEYTESKKIIIVQYLINLHSSISGVDTVEIGQWIFFHHIGDTHTPSVNAGVFDSVVDEKMSKSAKEILRIRDTKEKYKKAKTTNTSAENILLFKRITSFTIPIVVIIATLGFAEEAYYSPFNWDKTWWLWCLAILIISITQFLLWRNNK